MNIQNVCNELSKTSLENQKTSTGLSYFIENDNCSTRFNSFESVEQLLMQKEKEPTRKTRLRLRKKTKKTLPLSKSEEEVTSLSKKSKVFLTSKTTTKTKNSSKPIRKQLHFDPMKKVSEEKLNLEERSYKKSKSLNIEETDNQPCHLNIIKPKLLNSLYSNNGTNNSIYMNINDEAEEKINQLSKDIFFLNSHKFNFYDR